MTQPITSPASAKLLRAAIWVAIGALIAAAFVCVVWVLFGPEERLVARAFLTILLLAGFAGVAILEARLAPGRPAWFALASMATWVLTLLIGAFMIWMPEPDRYFGVGVDRFFRFLLIVLILQLALLHVRLFTKAHARYATTFTTTVTYVTIGLVVILAVMLVLPLLLSDYLEFEAIYWRIVVALAILAAVGTALVPLVNVLFAPKRERPKAAAYAGGPAQPQAAQWPTYADGFTPLPVMPDGSPDWNAYYTGYPTYPQNYAAAAPAPQAIAQPPAYDPHAAQAAPAQTADWPSPQGEAPQPQAYAQPEGQESEGAIAREQYEGDQPSEETRPSTRAPGQQPSLEGQTDAAAPAPGTDDFPPVPPRPPLPPRP
ncbi:hypothetical protein QNO21_11985 [Microbacterium sp. zg-Y818]|uniref:hypothetical protein n=1 Tax=unclassified Microbacterium TaxID=2609290 RepID=UPI00214B30BE|nr:MULTISPECIES: hypothetical protein [unclassified Microbacterium]MCR2799842.1 hypothetical protein [Microbacterium sp. zg.Y818]WIM21825.1 hypothetical protein QNO21_11985 [Microbacterium sp. zg-Y818]